MSLTETATEQSVPWEGKPTTKEFELDGGKRGVEITVDGQSAEMRALFDAARNEQGEIDYDKIDRTKLQANSRAFDLLLGETPDEAKTRLQAIVGKRGEAVEDFEITQAAIATRGEDEARRRAFQYGGVVGPDGHPVNPLAKMLKDEFYKIDNPQSQQEAQITESAPAEVVEGEVPVEVTATEVNEQEATELDIASSAAEIGKILTNLNGYVITKHPDGSVTITEKR